MGSHRLVLAVSTAAALATTAVLPAANATTRASAVHVSVSVAPATAKVGSFVVVSGTVAPHIAGAAVVVQREVGHLWVSMGHTKTTAGGRYSLRLQTPKKAATWLLRVTRTSPASSRATSATVQLRAVTKSFTVKATTGRAVASGAAIVVHGTVSPKTGGSVTLQRLQGKSWQNLASGTLGSSSTFQVGKLLPPGTYRLRVAKAFTTKIAAGTSATLPVTVAAPTPAEPPTVPMPVPPAPVTPSVTTTGLPAAIVGKPYSITLSASAGQAPYSWSVPAASLPAGFALSAGGVLAGFPSAAGTFSLAVRANGCPWPRW